MEKATVLVVYSEKSVLKIIQSALGLISYDIIATQTGREGLARLKDYPVDIVLADQSIPDMTCLDFLTAVKSEQPDIVTIMLAGQIDLDTTIRAINEAGIYRIIVTPWNSFELRINVSRGIEYKKMLREKRRLLEEIRKNYVSLAKIEENFAYDESVIKEVTENFDGQAVEELSDECMHGKIGRKTRGVLVVDDEQAILDLAIDTLKQLDYQVITAKSGEEGLEVLRRHPIDLIVSDQRMDGMSGVEFLKIVREEYPGILTIMLTGYADTETAMQAVNEAGIYKFIVKPWKIVDFRNTLERAFELQHLIFEKDELKNILAWQQEVLQGIHKEHPEACQQQPAQAEDDSIRR